MNSRHVKFLLKHWFRMYWFWDELNFSWKRIPWTCIEEEGIRTSRKNSSFQTKNQNKGFKLEFSLMYQVTAKKGCQIDGGCCVDFILSRSSLSIHHFVCCCCCLLFLPVAIYFSRDMWGDSSGRGRKGKRLCGNIW